MIEMIVFEECLDQVAVLADLQLQLCSENAFTRFGKWAQVV